MVTSDRSGELDCAVNAIFSQAPVNPSTGYFSDAGGMVQSLFENFYGLTEDIGGITVWAIMWDAGNCYTPGTQDFEITFYQDNAGTVGAMFQPPFNVTVTPTETGSFLNGSSVLRYDIDLPSSISLTNGWFSLVKLNPTNDPCTFGWLNTTVGDNKMAYTHAGGAITPFIENLHFV